MDRLIYTALTGMNSAMARQRAVANNLANTGTPGFRGESFAVTPVTVKGSALEVRALSQGGVRGADMRGGRLSTTGQALDIAMKGNALMALQIAHRGYVIQTGEIVLHDDAKALQKNETVQKAYLGME